MYIIMVLKYGSFALRIDADLSGNVHVDKGWPVTAKVKAEMEMLGRVWRLHEVNEANLMASYTKKGNMKV